MTFIKPSSVTIATVRTRNKAQSDILRSAHKVRISFDAIIEGAGIDGAEYEEDCEMTIATLVSSGVVTIEPIN